MLPTRVQARKGVRIPSLENAVCKTEISDHRSIINHMIIFKHLVRNPKDAYKPRVINAIASVARLPGAGVVGTKEAL